MATALLVFLALLVGFGLLLLVQDVAYFFAGHESVTGDIVRRHGAER